MPQCGALFRAYPSLLIVAGFCQNGSLLFASEERAWNQQADKRVSLISRGSISC